MQIPEEEEKRELETQLTPFLENNPYSGVQKKGKSWTVINPWSDESVSFILRPDEYKPDLIAALNNLILPQRLTALYHLDSNEIEYIYTLLDSNHHCCSRKFEITFDGKTYLCKFADASERLLLLSRYFRPTGVETKTEYRNLMLFSLYANKRFWERVADEHDFLKGKKPISFFIGGFEKFNEDNILDISKHLNFFMQYYDRKSPVIVIHSVENELTEPIKQLQFLETTFPEKISFQHKDPFLLELALTAMDVEPRLKFLYFYQILEYAAFSYIDTKIRRELLNIINAPDIHCKADTCVANIFEKFNSSPDENTKMNQLVKAACALETVWKELQQNIPYFSKPQEFDGGFKLEPIISEEMTFDTFSPQWEQKTVNTIRSIRHALVHSREKRVISPISPTRRNDRLIKPWLGLTRRIAEQVIIYGQLT